MMARAAEAGELGTNVCWGHTDAAADHGHAANHSEACCNQSNLHVIRILIKHAASLRPEAVVSNSSPRPEVMRPRTDFEVTSASEGGDQPINAFWQNIRHRDDWHDLSDCIIYSASQRSTCRTPLFRVYSCAVRIACLLLSVIL
jgi:hypothetical protein